MTTDGPASELTARHGLVDVVLPETPSTGYRWALEGEVEGAQVVGDRFEDHPTAGPTAGAGGARTFSLHVSGTVEIPFVLKRPWDSEPLERRTVTVTATD